MDANWSNVYHITSLQSVLLPEISAFVLDADCSRCISLFLTQLEKNEPINGKKVSFFNEFPALSKTQ
ncbi:hypothetical protein DMA11_19235 [Marinilabiliaceae bacterium JC017]|nr:hypothetical protein DMA11_19235 [Marinilabiliaceae bacterium JC017]